MVVGMEEPVDTGNKPARGDTKLSRSVTDLVVLVRGNRSKDEMFNLHAQHNFLIKSVIEMDFGSAHLVHQTVDGLIRRSNIQSHLLLIFLIMYPHITLINEVHIINVVHYNKDTLVLCTEFIVGLVPVMIILSLNTKTVHGCLAFITNESAKCPKHKWSSYHRSWPHPTLFTVTQQ